MIVREDGAGLLLLQNADDLTVLRRMAAMPRRFSDYGLRMKTGLTLPSRYPDLLSDKPEPGAVPLIHPRSLGSGRVTFPAKGLHGQFIRPSIPSLIQKNRNMLFLKRFPAKTDPRKLICAVYMASQAGGYRFISTHNKLNYVDREGDEMDPSFLVGLYAALSGSLYNRYVSIISRSEQINATELSDLPLPDETTLRSVGSQLLSMRRLDPEACDYVFEAAMKEKS
jgi:adenine-specific DNA-methyltransferase